MLTLLEVFDTNFDIRSVLERENPLQFLPAEQPHLIWLHNYPVGSLTFPFLIGKLIPNTMNGMLLYPVVNYRCQCSCSCSIRLLASLLR